MSPSELFKGNQPRRTQSAQRVVVFCSVSSMRSWFVYDYRMACGRLYISERARRNERRTRGGLSGAGQATGALDVSFCTSGGIIVKFGNNCIIRNKTADERRFVATHPYLFGLIQD